MRYSRDPNALLNEKHPYDLVRIVNDRIRSEHRQGRGAVKDTIRELLTEEATARGWSVTKHLHRNLYRLQKRYSVWHRVAEAMIPTIQSK